MSEGLFQPPPPVAPLAPSLARVMELRTRRKRGEICRFPRRLTKASDPYSLHTVVGGLECWLSRKSLVNLSRVTVSWGDFPGGAFLPSQHLDL